MRHTRQLALGAVLLLSGGAIAACGDGPDRTESDGGGNRTVAIRSFEFRPARIDVEVGSTVVWSNEDDILHTVTSGMAGEQGVPGVSEDVAPTPDGYFDLELDGTATSAPFTFEEPGTYAYFCAIHSGMSGSVQVA